MLFEELQSPFKKAWQRLFYLWPTFFRLGMFERCWTNYGFPSENIRGHRGQITRARFLGPICLLSTLFTARGCLVLWFEHERFAWFRSPWWRVTFLTGILPQGLVIPAETIFFYYSLLSALVPAYEMLVPWRRFDFMDIFAETADDRGFDDMQLTKLKKYQQKCLQRIRFGIVLSNCATYLGVFSVGFLEHRWVMNQFWFWFWAVYLFIYLFGTLYANRALPGLLMMIVYCVRMHQLRIEAEIKKLEKVRHSSTLIRLYKMTLKHTIRTHRMMDQLNGFWPFPLMLYINVYPIIITFCFYFIPQATPSWVAWFVFAIIIYTSQLSLIVRKCVSVEHGHQTVTKQLLYVYRRRVERRLVGNSRMHLHFDKLIDNVRLATFGFSTVDGQLITSRTYFMVIIKFGFIFFEVLSKHNFD